MANRLRAQLFILHAAKLPEESFTQEMREKIEKWKLLSSQFNAVFLLEHERNRKPADIIIETATKHHVTQILLGQSARTRWEEIRKGSIVNTIMRKTENIDIHIVSDGKI